MDPTTCTRRKNSILGLVKFGIPKNLDNHKLTRPFYNLYSISGEKVMEYLRDAFMHDFLINLMYVKIYNYKFVLIKMFKMILHLISKIIEEFSFLRILNKR